MTIPEIIGLIAALYPCWAFFQIARDEINSHIARRTLPALAKELNLLHKPGGRLGSYSGLWNGHPFRIAPHDGSAVSIKVRCNPGFAASHIAYSQLPPLNWFGTALMHLIDSGSRPDPQFSFDDPLLDAYLQHRELMDPAGLEIVNDPLIRKALHDFVSRNRFSVCGLRIGSDVACSLWTGGSVPLRAASVTARQVRRMLDEMAPMVRAIEEANARWENS